MRSSISALGSAFATPSARSGRVAMCGLLAVCTVAAFLFSAPAFAVLPENRVYEQVSPEFKAGYGVIGTRALSGISADGERAMFSSIGAFEGSSGDFGLNPYLAGRSSDGWGTEGVFPHTAGECLVNPTFSVDLSRVVLVGSLGLGHAECETSATNTLWVREPDGSLRQASPALTTVGGIENSLTVVAGSRDFSRILFLHSDPPLEHILAGEIDDETASNDELYEVEGSHAGLVGVDNAGIQLTRYCDVNLGGVGTSELGAVSQPAAAEVFFSVPVNSRKSEDQCSGVSSSPEQLFMRVGGSRTVEVSRPLGEACFEVPCPKASQRAPAAYQGASEDGSVVYFTMADDSSEPLVAGSSDHSSNLYVAKIGCAGGTLGEACGSSPREVVSMELASPDLVAGQAAEVQPSVLAISPDGSHAYFVAHGVLSEAANGQGEIAADGAENLYVYNRGLTPARVSFIAQLCSGPELSGSVRDTRCPSSLNEEALGVGGRNDRALWSAGFNREVQTTHNGRFLVFGTFARLIAASSEADVDSAEDIYRYDAQTGWLRRVSVAEAGQEGNGNGSLSAHITAVSPGSDNPQAQAELSDRAITDDGSRVVFLTSEKLSARDATGEQDVYVWDEGHVGMISCGCSAQPDEEPAITPSGRDILFLTSGGLLPGDRDGLPDLYDARVEGGFPEPEAPNEACRADACYGPLSTPAPILLPGSVTQQAEGNLPAPPPVAGAPQVKKKAKPRKAHKARRRGEQRGRHSRGSVHRVASGRRER